MSSRGRAPRMRMAIVELLTEHRLAAWQIADALGYSRKSVQAELRCIRLLGLPCIANLLDGRGVKRQPGDLSPTPVVEHIRAGAEPRGPTADEVVETALRSRHPLDGWLR